MVWGYDDKIEIFKKLISEKKLGNAYLFYGEPEIGKFTFAKELAYLIETASLNQNTPLLDTLILDIKNEKEYEANNGEEKKEEGADEETLSKNRIIEAKDFLYKSPLISERKTLIINDSQNLTREAQSALLKIVEEPPEKSLIIFIAPDKDVLFPPLLSRLIKIYFPTLPKSKVFNFIKEKYKLDDKKSQEIANASFGRIGRAIKILTEEKKEKLDDENINDLEEYINQVILRLYFKDLQKNVKILKFFIERNTIIKKYKRYNLNLKLQKMVIDATLKKYGKI
jgi:DNA polymerase III delta prime subunit